MATWSGLAEFFARYGGDLRADLKVHSPAALADVARIEACAAAAGDAEAAAQAADGVLAVTQGLLEGGGWTHVCFREAHVVALLTLAVARCHRQQPRAAMEAADRAAIFGIPPGAEAIVAACDELCKQSEAAVGLPAAAAARPFPSDPPADPLLKAVLSSARAVQRLDLGGEAQIEDRFVSDFYKKERPVVLAGDPEVAAWPALERWVDPAYLLSVAGWRTVPIELGSKRKGTWREATEVFRDFVLNRLCASAEDSVVEPAYLAQHELLKQISALSKDITLPSALNGVVEEDQVIINCWIGTADTVTELHKDSFDNLFVQVAGYKYVRLYAPAQAKRLYVSKRGCSGAEAQGNCSAVRCEAEDYSQYPLAEDAQYLECVLGPGEALFIPEGWFHYLRALTPSISVNHWF
ncbi:JmjC domain-containing protein F [Diplonema papillatum]|nr:JmjC domain-containing protein F [Diplonema papillatum]